MKLIHLSDLHLGKRVNEYSMLEDQEYILKKVINIIDDEKPDGVIIAGDVYDKSVPSAEATQLFDDWLVKLAARKLQVYIISGNHDSAERLAFGGRLMDLSGIHMSPVYNGKVEPIVQEDEFGEVAVYMLPFIKPAHVRAFYPDEEIASYTDAVRVAVSNMDIDPDRRNVLVTHQFVTGAERSESEEISVGGTDNVDASVFDAFDYVALGHIHGPQNAAGERVRYCGTPLKYSFSEAAHTKSMTVVELGAGDALEVRTVVLEPKRDMVEIRGRYTDVIADAKGHEEDYVRIILLDEEDVPDALTNLRLVYHNLMKLEYDNTRTRHSAEIHGATDVREKSMLEHFSELYELQNGMALSEDQIMFLNGMIEKIEEANI
ncbi:MAG: exonuclease SbcCD subunit D [Clostridiales bacterium]|nr:exonuclease SbcCD subunit D [Candidatus Crickella merdequi]